MKNQLPIFAFICTFLLSVAQLAQAQEPTSATRGAYLAKVGNCMSCHTQAHGEPFAGGLKMLTPVGAIYSTNITPDKTTGIGKFTLQDFTNAMRKGVSKDGHNLYPAMPYPSYAKVNDADIKALYAYFMTEVNAVEKANKKSDIPWPLNARWPLKIWNFLFLKDARYQDKPNQTASWNRGAYLTQGLGHCGACHTPRGLAFQEKALDESNKKYLTGAVLDGWSATNLANDYNTGLKRWSQSDVLVYLKYGANQHSASFGSMTEVINNSTQAMVDEDLSAMAEYLKSLPETGDKGQTPYNYDNTKTAEALGKLTQHAGARLYAQYCMACHGANGKGAAPFLSPLAGTPALLDPDPSSLINVTLNGSYKRRTQGVTAPYFMPKFRDSLNDEEIAAVVSFMRESWNHNLDAIKKDQVADIRKLNSH
jgi:alcohol dehydrogenase (quinone), cytochrome c subunit